ncbi:unnamed protein product [Arctogadus glacialis]
MTPLKHDNDVDRSRAVWFWTSRTVRYSTQQDCGVLDQQDWEELAAPGHKADRTTTPGDLRPRACFLFVSWGPPPFHQHAAGAASTPRIPPPAVTVATAMLGSRNRMEPLKDCQDLELEQIQTRRDRG